MQKGQETKDKGQLLCMFVDEKCVNTQKLSPAPHLICDYSVCLQTKSV